MESFLRRHAKSSGLVAPNANDVHFIGASAIVLYFLPQHSVQPRDRKRLRSLRLICRTFDFV